MQPTRPSVIPPIIAFNSYPTLPSATSSNSTSQLSTSSLAFPPLPLWYSPSPPLSADSSPATSERTTQDSSSEATVPSPSSSIAPPRQNRKRAAPESDDASGSSLPKKRKAPRAKKAKKNQTPTPHYCETCEKFFSSAENLTRHMKSTVAHCDDSEQTVYSCCRCKATFSRSSSRNRHEDLYCARAERPTMLPPSNEQFSGREGSSSGQASQMMPPSLPWVGQPQPQMPPSTAFNFSMNPPAPAPAPVPYDLSNVPYLGMPQQAAMMPTQPHAATSSNFTPSHPPLEYQQANLQSLTWPNQVDAWSSASSTQPTNSFDMNGGNGFATFPFDPSTYNYATGFSYDLPLDLAAQMPPTEPAAQQMRNELDSGSIDPPRAFTSEFSSQQPYPPTETDFAFPSTTFPDDQIFGDWAGL